MRVRKVKSMKKVNVNDFVRVKLTKRGIEIYEDYYKDILLCKGVGNISPEIDKDGYTRLQLWELMNIFGKSMVMGCTVPFETTILIEDAEK